MENGQEFEYAPEESAGSQDPEQNQENQNANEAGQTTAEAQQLADLSTYERFKLGDKELTRDQLEKGIMYQSDYTKKTQEIAQERRYYSNLQADLEKVAKNPALAAEFRKVYPQQFHNYLGYVTKTGQTSSQGADPTSTQPKLTDPRLEKIDTLEQKLQAYEQERAEERVGKAEAQIDSLFTKFSAKYPMAAREGDEYYVISRAQQLIAAGEPLDEKSVEKIFKEAHDKYKSFVDGHYKTMNNNQKAAHVRGKDIGSGGGVPGGAPRMPRTIKDATRIAEEDLGRR